MKIVFDCTDPVEGPQGPREVHRPHFEHCWPGAWKVNEKARQVPCRQGEERGVFGEHRDQRGCL